MSKTIIYFTAMRAFLDMELDRFFEKGLPYVNVELDRFFEKGIPYVNEVR